MRGAVRAAAPLVAAAAASAGVFALAAASPRNPLAAVVDGWEFLEPQTKQAMEAAYLSQGWLGAWWQWLVSLLTSGDPGYSRTLRQPVIEVLLVRGLNTLVATSTALLMCAIVLTAVITVFSLWPRIAGSRVLTGAVGAWLTAPSFLIAVLAVLFFGAHLPNPATTAPIVQMPLVAAVIAFSWAAPMVANVRAAALEQADSQWGKALVGRGAGPALVLRSHAPGLAKAALAYGFLVLPQVVVGEAAVEAIFAYPGIGNTVVAATVGSDLPFLATVTALAAFIAAAVWAWRPTAGEASS